MVAIIILCVFSVFILAKAMSIPLTENHRWLLYFVAFNIAYWTSVIVQILVEPETTFLNTISQPILWLLPVIIIIWGLSSEVEKHMDRQN
jgi:hypothetical protein